MSIKTSLAALRPRARARALSAALFPDRPIEKLKKRGWKYVLATTAFLAGLHLIFLYKATLFLTDSSHWVIKAYILLTGTFLLSRFLIAQFYRDEHPSSADHTHATTPEQETHPAHAYPFISFVIAGKNEENSIYKTIEACMSSRYPGFMECIAVNDGSSDGTEREMFRAARDLGNIGKGITIISLPENR